MVQLETSKQYHLLLKGVSPVALSCNQVRWDYPKAQGVETSHPGKIFLYSSPLSYQQAMLTLDYRPFYDPSLQLTPFQEYLSPTKEIYIKGKNANQLSQPEPFVKTLPTFPHPHSVDSFAGNDMNDSLLVVLEFRQLPVPIHKICFLFVIPWIIVQIPYSPPCWEVPS